MKIQKTINILKCDKCGAEAGQNGNVYSVNGMDLCEKCIDKWDKFINDKQKPIIDKFFIDNSNLKQEFKDKIYDIKSI